MDKFLCLKKYFGYDSFRKGQEQVIDAILSGQDTLLVMPTGAGKSLCFQVPAMCLSGITLVISPLISIMKDQVEMLKQNGIPAAFINSTLDLESLKHNMANLRAGNIKVVYIAPERLHTEAFAAACNHIDIDFIAVDEAHCISKWGPDFRPSYLEIFSFISKLKKRPVIGAFTATATPAVVSDICNKLCLNSPYISISSFDRPNIFIEKRFSTHKQADLLEFLCAHKGVSGIIYCASRRLVDDVCDTINENGFMATKYHAGLDSAVRNSSQDDFIFGRIPIIVATNAFGMGINKLDVRYVLFYNMPADIEGFYQGIGRAGRDGDPATCLLLYNDRDIALNRFLIEHSSSAYARNDDQMKFDLERLNSIVQFTHTNDCLRRYILDYFGERTKSNCKSCSNCVGTPCYTDITINAQKILSCVKRVGEAYDKRFISNILNGSLDNQVTSSSFHELSTFGILQLGNKEVIKQIDYLIQQGYLEESLTADKRLMLTKKSILVLKSQRRIIMRIDPHRIEQEYDTDSNAIDAALFDKLVFLRQKLAKRQHIPVYMVCTERTLREIARQKPTTLPALLDISGIGNYKAQMYGKQLLDVVRNHH